MTDCTKCGTVNNDTAKFCKKCGIDLVKVRVAEAEEAKQKKAAELKKVFQKNSQWEYKIVNLFPISDGITATGHKLDPKDEKELNALGTEGWELVSAIPMNSIAPRLGVSSASATECVSCIFKRRI